MSFTNAFDIERIGSTLVLNLKKRMQEIEFADATMILESLRMSRGSNVIVDCHDVDFLRSLVLGFFVTLSKRVNRGGGQMVFCNVSPKARQILRATKLDRVWTICGSRDEAIVEIAPPSS
jgi:anti-anti-sigma factor